MAVRVRGEKSKDVELYLEDDGDGGVRLMAVDGREGFEDWYLATITKNGIELTGGLPTHFGIATDSGGEVVIL